MNIRPQLIVVTPVRNEAWVLEAFLTCTSSWADYIIIADHHSTDGSREIALRFPKVILIDNPCNEWVEYECRARLLEEAAKIKGDKIIFGIDADEFLSEGFDKTEGWRRIINSEPNEIFFFDWLNLYDNFYTAAVQKCYGEWAAHYSADTDFVSIYRQTEHNSVHASRIACLDGHQCPYTAIEDIKFVHLAKLNHNRNQNKMDFYQVVNIDKNPNKANPVTMYRAYNDYYPENLIHIEHDIKLYCAGSEEYCNHLVRESDNGQHYIDEIAQIIEREGEKKFAELGIWDNPDIIAKVTPPKRNVFIKAIMRYLKATQPYHRNNVIHLVDGFLKRLVK